MAADGLRWQDGQWVVSPTASLAMLHQGLPDTVEGLVLSRIDRLSEAHKLTLRVASVIGHTFALDLLALAHPIHPNMHELREQIETLEIQGFTRRESGVGSGPGSGYGAGGAGPPRNTPEESVFPLGSPGPPWLARPG